MHLSIGYFSPEENWNILKFSPDDKTQVETWDNQNESQTPPSQTFFLYPEDWERDEVRERYKQWRETCHFVTIEDKTFGTKDQLASLSYQSIADRYYQALNYSILENNLKSIESLVAYSKEYHEYWKSSPSQFFNKFWYFIKLNAMTSYIKIIFNDVLIDESKEDGQRKSKLIHRQVEGQDVLEELSCSEAEERLFQEFLPQISASIKFLQNEAKEEELVITAKIQDSPVLILLKVVEFNKLQESLIRGLIRGINDLN